jgi:hypothetical protein
VLYWDADSPKALPGFGVLVSGKTGKRTYVVQRDLPGGRTRRATIGHVNELTLEKARDQAAQLLQDMRKGIDPKAARRGALTLAGALEAYVEARAHLLRPRTVAHYRGTLELHLSDWLDRPLVELTRDMVERRHRKIAEDVEAAHRAAAAEAAKRHAAKAKRWGSRRKHSASASCRARPPSPPTRYGRGSTPRRRSTGRSPSWSSTRVRLTFGATTRTAMRRSASTRGNFAR